ncbi:hypothetical protein HK101_000766 [Irineochytrium annulatum]|nr:hypothetical protein HK101_000766 [Irineochytrium annulatum]
MVPTATGSLTTVSTVPTVPCSPPKAQDNNLYTFTIQNSLPYNISAWVQIGCQGKFGSSLAAVTLPDGKSSVGVVNATSGQVYFIKSNDTNLAPNQILDVLVFAPAFNGLTWNITTASLGSTLDGNNTGSGGSSPSAVPYIVAAVIGGLGILAAIAVIGYFVYRKKRNGSSISSMFSKFNKKDGMSIGTPNNAEMSSTLDPVNRTGTLPPYGSMKRDNESSYGSSARLTNTIGRNNESSTGTLNKNGTYNRSQLAPAAQDNKRTSLLWWTTPSAGAAAAASTVSSSAAGATSPTTPTSPRSKEDIMVPGARLRVIHQHRASLEDELTLSPGDQVVLLESYGDGWCLARVVRSRRAHEGGSKVGEDGMVPVGCLDSADRTLTRGQGSGTTTEERSKRVKSLQRPESVALFMAAGRKPEDYYK